MVESVLQLLQDLYDTQEWYFEDDKDLKISQLFQTIENQLEEDQYFLQGKLYNYSDVYDIRAEKYLTKSVKLDPMNIEGWNSLAMCYWKKGDKETAILCYQHSNQICTNKIALRDLSMLYRQISTGGEDRMIKSIESAQQAVELDPTDHKSWYLLGNTLTAKYFSNSNDIKDLLESLQAYSTAELHGGKKNPDLYYNRGMVLQYVLDFHGALQAYHTSFSIDKRLSDSKRLFNELNSYIHRINNHISEQIVSLHKIQFPITTQREKSSTCHIGQLKIGINKKKVITLKILADIAYSVPPCNYLCVDIQNKLVLVSFYNMADGIRYFRVDQTLVIKAPIVLERKEDPVSLEWNRLRQDIPIIQIFDLKSVTADEKTVPDELIVPTVLKSILLNGDDST